ncbi:MAG: response regulator [Lachnospiraceae bacterium]|nr:response regulator [Lachnospiraceae bacterium]
MGDKNKQNERGMMAQVSMVLAILVFSFILILEDVLLDRELWMVPVMAVMAVISIIIHVSRAFENNYRTYIYAAFLMLELFYYATNSATVYDTTPVVVLLLVILAMSEDVRLLYICMIVGYSGMIYHLIVLSNTRGLDFDVSAVLRTGLSFLLVLFAGIVVVRLMKTQSRQLESFQELLDEVIEENKRANNFLANVSHEIRTPINAVIGLSTVSLKKGLDKEIRGNMESIKSAGYRVADQIGDILDYTEIDMSKLSVSEETYMISSIVNDIVNQSMTIKPPDKELIFDVDSRIPQMLIGDGTKIKKILWHLISNGIKFTKEGGVYVHIWSMPREYGINLCMEVKDTGIGITEEEQERIFEKFYQTDSGRTRTAGGLGLGLSIVQGFVRALGGFLSIDSKYGSGTSVKVSVPQKIEDPTPCMGVRNSESLCLIGYFEFRQFTIPMVREFYHNMIRHLTKGLDVTMHMAANAEDVTRLIGVYNVTHLLIGAGEYMANTDYIEAFTGEIDVLVIADDDFKPRAGSSVKIMHKPFYCFPIANMLNAAATNTEIKEDYARIYCPGVRALVVDDEPMNLIVADGIFRNYGMKVIGVSSGPEAIDKCQEEDFDLVFMDHMMPGMDGIEAMHKIRANAAKQGKEFGIIALTANAVSSAKEMFLSEGFDGFVPKPIDLAELDRVLKRVLPKSAIVYEAPSEIGKSEDTVSGGSDTEGIKNTDIDVNKNDTVEPDADISEKPDPKTHLFEALKYAGVDTASGLNYCQNDAEFYKILLAQYGNDSPKKMEEMAVFFKEKNWPDYAIRVHGLKSTSKMIGANAVSELAKELEMAAKVGDGDVIERNHDRVMKMYRELVSVVAEGLDLKLPGITGSEEAAVDEDEVLEFGPDGAETENDDDVLEFAPEGSTEEEAIEFAPADSNSKGGEQS